MSWTNIFDGEEGLTIRNKINNAMNSIFAAIGGGSLWQDVSGENNVEPKDGKGVKTPTLETDELVLAYLASSWTGTKILVVSNDGEVSLNLSVLELFDETKFGKYGESHINFHPDRMHFFDDTDEGFKFEGAKINFNDRLQIETEGATAIISDETGTGRIKLDDNDVDITAANEIVLNVGNANIMTLGAENITLSKRPIFKAIPRYTNDANIVTNISAAYTLADHDAGKYFRHTGASTLVLTVPENLNWGNGELIEIRRTAAGNAQIISGTNNVEINPSDPVTTVLNDTLRLIKVAANKYDVVITSAGDIPKGGNIVTTFSGAEHQISPAAPVIMVPDKAENVDLILPVPSEALNLEVTVKKFYDNAYAVSIWTTGSGSLIFHKGESNAGITTTQFNASVRLKCDGTHWWVIQDNGTWTLTA